MLFIGNAYEHASPQRHTVSNYNTDIFTIELSD
jgi:hypothetical protein